MVHGIHFEVRPDIPRNHLTKLKDFSSFAPHQLTRETLAATLDSEMIGTGLHSLKALLRALAVGLALLASACGGGVSPDRVEELEEKVAALEDRIGGLEDQQVQPTTALTGMDMDTMSMGPLQEIGLIENYAATQFFPRWMVVLKDIPVRIYLTRLHREHVNRFTIQPFHTSSAVILPDEIGVIEFLPDQVGEFKIRNVGHNFEADLVVVEIVEEAKRLISERGRQMYSLIHSVDDFQIFPQSLVLQQGIPARVHNISLIAEHQVSFKPYHDPEGINVRPREVTIIDFTPEEPGQFTIRHELHGFTGDLIVDE